ncbi:cell envelope integrity protein CreD [Myxacorys almedinensis]|uniref:Cell envelope integrity protein CreD n=1 Tax=Myxacorys almedinensis A TaxID=2690445 RepID=A0A8J7Z3G8_9CYAN|nr:cell envelope integrity protein CreD [Myxacorys almedinensis]NDJ15808.1 cell envelope integrity protein CreD [Myxacorys almedinensis A]
MNFYEQIKNSQFFRVLFIAFLILLLQIPTVMLQNLVSDRQSLRQEAIAGITGNWGRSQSILGPRLYVPYIKRFQVGTAEKAEVKYGTFLPDDLQITGNLDSEVRYRGIFEVPVYKTKLDLRGRFVRPDFTTWGTRPEDILWDRAELSLQISDAHAIQNQASLGWNQKTIPFTAGQGKYGSNEQGIHAVLKDAMQADTFAFSIPITVNGSEKIAFAPFGKVTKVSLTSDWTNPSFQGVWLPNERSITQKGFDATWNIPSLGRNYPQQWNNEVSSNPEPIQASLFGVDLISPVDNYRMADRSIKYNFLFLMLTFAVFWLFETATRLRVHPLQYLLVGVAMSIFYLLQLALSEHLGFKSAYLLSSIAVVTLITTYSIAVLRARKRGAIIGVMQVALYSYLYVVLANQDYSLLMGSIGLFAFLAIVMYFTRRMDGLEPPTARRIEPTSSGGTPSEID